MRRATNVYSMGFGSPERALRSVSWDTDSGCLLWKACETVREEGLEGSRANGKGPPGGSVLSAGARGVGVPGNTQAVAVLSQVL